MITLKMISTLGQATYMGRELEKAEIAMKLGKTFIQDERLFI